MLLLRSGVTCAAMLSACVSLSTIAVADGPARSMPAYGQPYSRPAPYGTPYASPYASIKDTPVRDPFSWTGFYVGGNIGGGWSDASAKFSNLPTPVAGGGDGRYSVDESGVVGGLQAGHNWQISQMVVGIEGDISWLGADRGSSAIAIDQGAFPGVSERLSSRTDWLATLRGRIGYAFGTVLVYATGGVAWGDVKVGYRADNAGATGFSTTQSDVETGWTVGGGVDVALNPNWILRGEYLHVDLGSTTLVTPLNGASLATSTRFDNRFDIVRAALSYKF